MNVYFREAVDVPLSFKLKNGESQFFTCRVTYEIVENGEKVTKIQVRPLFHDLTSNHIQEYRFPESGEISYGEQKPNPIETDGGEIRADPINDKDDETEATDDDHSNPGEEENPEEKGGYYI